MRGKTGGWGSLLVKIQAGIIYAYLIYVCARERRKNLQPGLGPVFKVHYDLGFGMTLSLVVHGRTGEHAPEKTIEHIRGIENVRPPVSRCFFFSGHAPSSLCPIRLRLFLDDLPTLRGYQQYASRQTRHMTDVTG